MKTNVGIYLTKNIENSDRQFIENISIEVDPKDFLNLTKEEVEKEFINTIESQCNEYIINTYNIGIDNLQISNLFLSKFLPEYNKLILEETNNSVYLLCFSEQGDRDWYGDFNYLSNPLGKYVECKKQCETNTLRGSGHGYGVAGYIVKTTKNFIEMMGWEDDLKYKITREEYLKLKK